MEESMDIDIDLGHDIDYGQMEEYNTPTDTTTAQPEEKAIPEAYKDEFDADFPVREKLHLKGLNHVAQPLIYDFLDSYDPGRKLRRLEWIDDNSANLVYFKSEDAAEALIKLTASMETLPGILELRPTKVFAARPDVELSIRQALVSDKKKPGAKDRSAFYLFNPEWDPENRRRDDRRYNDRGNGERNGRNAPRQRRQPVEKPFTVDMYDDAPAVLTEGSEDGELIDRLSTTSVSSREEGRKKRKYEDADLFPSKRQFVDRIVGKLREAGRGDGRLRDRSRSPLKEGDGRYGFEEDQPRRKTARRRSVTPPHLRNRTISNNNARKELFPSRVSASPSTPLSNDNHGVELFPRHTSNRSRELFPNKTALSNHRRTDALNKDETDQILSPPPSRSLADRITGAPSAPNSDHGVTVKGRGSTQSGFSIRGASEIQPGLLIRGASNADQGVSIRGAAAELNPRVKELFPAKLTGPSYNAGKELMPHVRGRGNQRNKAEEFFD